MSKVIIFGVMDFAELAHFYLCHDSEHEVVAFCVDRAYLPNEPQFKALPVVAFEDVETLYPPSEYVFFAPMSPNKMNQVRTDVVAAIKNKGYSLISYVSSKATVFGNPIGENCFILEDNTIQPFVTIGNNVVLWSGNHIGHHSSIGDNVTITSHVVVSGHCKIDAFSFFGVNATLRDGIHIAEGTFVAMACAVTADTEPWSVYKGNPAEKQSIPSTKLRW